jgi:hypothetical protein
MAKTKPRSAKRAGKKQRSARQALSDKDQRVRKRDGSTPAKAIIEDQNVWRRRNCPGFTVALQKLIGIDGRYFDELTLRSPEDGMRVVYFDVSDLFRKRDGFDEP